MKWCQWDSNQQSFERDAAALATELWFKSCFPESSYNFVDTRGIFLTISANQTAKRKLKNDIKKLVRPSKRVTAVDWTAAGDAFVGGFAFCMAQSEGLFEVALFANDAAALSVTKMGTIFNAEYERSKNVRKTEHIIVMDN